MNDEVLSNQSERWGFGGEEETGLEKLVGLDHGRPECQGRRPGSTLRIMGHHCKITVIFVLGRALLREGQRERQRPGDWLGGCCQDPRGR